MTDSKLDTIIKQVLAGEFGDEGGVMDFAGDRSAEEKAKLVINEIKKRDLDTKKVAFISIGGADGTELDYELRNTSSSHGILLEWDDRLSEKAYEKKYSLQKQNKQMQILTGDARQKIAVALGWIDKWKEEGKINCMVVTMFAFLHELPYRCDKSSDLISFLQNFYRNDINILILVREPIMPINLPEFLTISAKSTHSNLAKIANCIRDCHLELQDLGEVKELATGVRMPARLAMDTIFKLPYLRSFQYEIKELATFYTEDSYLRAFRHVFAQNAVADTSMQSSSYHKLYKSYDVKISNDNSQPLGIPRSHLGVVVDISVLSTKTVVQVPTPKAKMGFSSKVKGELVCVFGNSPHQKTRLPIAPNLWACPRLDKKYSCLNIQYDYESVKEFPISEEKGLRRYLPLLPVNQIEHSLCEGSTALFSNNALSKELRIDHLYFKDEGRNPTQSFKDRKTIIDINFALAMNATSLNCITSGNAGISLATYGRGVGLASKHFMANKKRSLKTESLYIKRLGGKIYCDPDAYEIPLSIGPQSREFNCTPGFDPIGMEGYKTIAWEIWEELDCVPDIVVMPVGSGEGFFGVFKGFLELKNLNLVDKIPRMVAVEPKECGILTKTKDWKNCPHEISDTNPDFIWKSHADQLVLHFMPCVALVLWAIEKSGGNVIATSNSEIQKALNLFINHTGLLIEPSSAVVVSALSDTKIKLNPSDKVVAILTGRGERYLYETLQLAQDRKREHLISLKFKEEELYIKKADLTDYREILPLYNELIKSGETTLSTSPIFVDDEAMFFAGLGDKECVFVVRQQNQLIGYGLLLEYRRDLGCSPHIAEIDMYFWTQYKNQDLQEALINEMIRYTTEKGYHKAVHECRSKEVEPVYGKVGFGLSAEFEDFYKHGNDIDKILVLELSDLTKITE